MNISHENNDSNLRLPQEIERYVASLNQIYRRKNHDVLQQLLVNAEISIEKYSYDNLDGGQNGFLMRLQIPEEIFSKVLEEKYNYEKEITENINKLIKIPHEFIDEVSIEMRLSDEKNWREKSGYVLPRISQVNRDKGTEF